MHKVFISLICLDIVFLNAHRKMTFLPNKHNPILYQYLFKSLLIILSVTKQYLFS